MASAVLGLLAVAAAAELVRLEHLTLGWARGEFRAPLICTVDGTPRQALRRLTVGPGPRSSPRYMNRIVFHDLDAPAGTACQDHSGREEPNAVGVIGVTYDDKSRRPDLAQYEFQEALRRKGGFRYEIETGRLQMGAAGVPRTELPWVDLRGGVIHLDRVQKGSDTARRLAEFDATRTFRMRLEAPDGQSWTFELVEWADGRPVGRGRPRPR